MLKNITPLIGEVYFIKFDGDESVQSGWRPGIIIQNNIGNMNSPNVIVAPFTTKIKNIHQPTHVFVPASGTGMREDSIVLCENPTTISKSRIGNYITRLPDKYLSDIAAAIMCSIPMISFLKKDELINLWDISFSYSA